MAAQVSWELGSARASIGEARDGGQRAARRRLPPSLPEPPFQTASALSIRTAAELLIRISYP